METRSMATKIDSKLDTGPAIDLQKDIDQQNDKGQCKNPVPAHFMIYWQLIHHKF